MTGQGINGSAENTSIGAPSTGGSLLCTWHTVDTTTTPIIVELYRDPLSRKWPLEKIVRRQLTRSVPKLSTDDLAGAVSAIVVRPGPNFNPKRLYRVTLYNAVNYDSWMLPLTFGVYPDLHRFSFGDLTHSVLFEYAEPGEVPLEDNWYSVSPYYKKH